jgi:hypothetical protein
MKDLSLEFWFALSSHTAFDESWTELEVKWVELELHWAGYCRKKVHRVGNSLVPIDEDVYQFLRKLTNVWNEIKFLV